MIPADLEQQAEEARGVRAWLASRRCVCGKCDVADVVECEECGDFQPACLAQTDWSARRVFCLKGCAS